MSNIPSSTDQLPPQKFNRKSQDGLQFSLQSLWPWDCFQIIRAGTKHCTQFPGKGILDWGFLNKFLDASFFFHFLPQRVISYHCSLFPTKFLPFCLMLQFPTYFPPSYFPGHPVVRKPENQSLLEINHCK